MNKTLLLFSVFLITNLLKAQEFKHNVYFANDEFTISSEEKEGLDKFIEKIKKYEILKIQLSGHTDYNHNNEYNQVLSKKRTLTVIDLLVRNKISKSKIRSKFDGEKVPVKTNETDEGRALNRRVEIFVTYIPINKKLSLSEIREIQQKLIPAQRFTIDPEKENVIKGKDGTILLFPKSIFECKSGGDICNEVEVVLKEYNNSTDMLCLLHKYCPNV